MTVGLGLSNTSHTQQLDGQDKGLVRLKESFAVNGVNGFIITAYYSCFKITGEGKVCHKKKVI